MDKHLFLDLDEVAATHNVEQRVCEATKHPANPVLPVGRLDEWDAVRASVWSVRTVLYDPDDGLFKCWYTGADQERLRWRRMGYAYSEDGVHWIKPKLGLFEFNGSKDNNICLDMLGAVIRDPTEPDPARRFKMVTKDLVGSGPARAAYSPDGIHWTVGPAVDLPALAHGPDIVVLALDEEATDPDRRYILIWQERVPAAKPGPATVRGKFIAYGPSVEKFTSSPDNPFLDPKDGLEQENHFLTLDRYGTGWISVYEFGWYVPNGLGVFGQYAADLRLAVSKDGEHFSRICLTDKVIPRGERGAWDAGFLVIGDRVIVKDDTIYIYYSGQGEDWSLWPPGNYPKEFGGGKSGSVRLTQLGLATLRLDGFTCMQTVDREISGSLETTPLEIEPDTRLNANVAEVIARRSWVDVDVLDAETGEVIPGFSREECVPLAVDNVRAAASWQGAELGACERRQVRLRFHIHGAARLHAYTLT